MKFVTYFYQNKEAVGILKEEEKAVFPLPFADMDTLIQTSKENLQLAVKETESSIPLVDVTLLAPIPRPRQDIICLGINYKAHAEEAERYSEEAFKTERPIPIYF